MHRKGKGPLLSCAARVQKRGVNLKRSDVIGDPP